MYPNLVFKNSNQGQFSKYCLFLVYYLKFQAIGGWKKASGNRNQKSLMETFSDAWWGQKPGWKDNWMSAYSVWKINENKWLFSKKITGMHMSRLQGWKDIRIIFSSIFTV